MSFPECERLASKHPDLKDIIIRIDELLSSCGHSSVFNPDDIASLLEERESRIQGVFEGLVKTGLLQEVKYLECPDCETLLEIASREKAIEKEEHFECTQCQRDLSGLELTEAIRYRLNPTVKIIRTSQPAEQSQQIIKPTRKTYFYVITEKGRQDLIIEQYEKLIDDTKKNRPYDMLIDGCSLYCYKKERNGKIKPDKLEGIEFALLREYIEDGTYKQPDATDAIKGYLKGISEAEGTRSVKSISAIKSLEKARGKVDIKLSRYEWRAEI